MLSHACSAPNSKVVAVTHAQYPAPNARDARRTQRRARREQRKALVLALMQRLLDLDAAEQGKCCQLCKAIHACAYCWAASSAVSEVQRLLCLWKAET